MKLYLCNILLIYLQPYLGLCSTTQDLFNYRSLYLKSRVNNERKLLPTVVWTAQYSDLPSGTPGNPVTFLFPPKPVGALAWVITYSEISGDTVPVIDGLYNTTQLLSIINDSYDIHCSNDKIVIKLAYVKDIQRSNYEPSLTFGYITETPRGTSEFSKSTIFSCAITDISHEIEIEIIDQQIYIFFQVPIDVLSLRLSIYDDTELIIVRLIYLDTKTANIICIRDCNDKISSILKFESLNSESQNSILNNTQSIYKKKHISTKDKPIILCAPIEFNKEYKIKYSWCTFVYCGKELEKDIKLINPAERPKDAVIKAENSNLLISWTIDIIYNCTVQKICLGITTDISTSCAPITIPASTTDCPYGSIFTIRIKTISFEHSETITDFDNILAAGSPILPIWRSWDDVNSLNTNTFEIFSRIGNKLQIYPHIIEGPATRYSKINYINIHLSNDSFVHKPYKYTGSSNCNFTNTSSGSTCYTWQALSPYLATIVQNSKDSKINIKIELNTTYSTVTTEKMFDLHSVSNVTIFPQPRNNGIEFNVISKTTLEYAQLLLWFHNDISDAFVGLSTKEKKDTAQHKLHLVIKGEYPKIHPSAEISCSGLKDYTTNDPIVTQSSDRVAYSALVVNYGSDENFFISGLAGCGPAVGPRWDKNLKYIGIYENQFDLQFYITNVMGDYVIQKFYNSSNDLQNRAFLSDYKYELLLRDNNYSKSVYLEPWNTANVLPPYTLIQLEHYWDDNIPLIYYTSTDLVQIELSIDNEILKGYINDMFSISVPPLSTKLIKYRFLSHGIYSPWSAIAEISTEPTSVTVNRFKLIIPLVPSPSAKIITNFSNSMSSSTNIMMSIYDASIDYRFSSYSWGNSNSVVQYVKHNNGQKKVRPFGYSAEHDVVINVDSQRYNEINSISSEYNCITNNMQAEFFQLNKNSISKALGTAYLNCPVTYILNKASIEYNFDGCDIILPEKDDNILSTLVFIGPHTSTTSLTWLSDTSHPLSSTLFRTGGLISSKFEINFYGHTTGGYKFWYLHTGLNGEIMISDSAHCLCQTTMSPGKFVVLSCTTTELKLSFHTYTGSLQYQITLNYIEHDFPWRDLPINSVSCTILDRCSLEIPISLPLDTRGYIRFRSVNPFSMWTEAITFVVGATNYIEESELYYYANDNSNIIYMYADLSALHPVFHPRLLNINLNSSEGNIVRPLFWVEVQNKLFFKVYGNSKTKYVISIELMDPDRRNIIFSSTTFFCQPLKNIHFNINSSRYNNKISLNWSISESDILYETDTTRILYSGIKFCDLKRIRGWIRNALFSDDFVIGVNTMPSYELSSDGDSVTPENEYDSESFGFSNPLIISVAKLQTYLTWRIGVKIGFKDISNATIYFTRTLNNYTYEHPIIVFYKRKSSLFTSTTIEYGSTYVPQSVTLTRSPGSSYDMNIVPNKTGIHDTSINTYSSITLTFSPNNGSGNKVVTYDSNIYHNSVISRGYISATTYSPAYMTFSTTTNYSYHSFIRFNDVGAQFDGYYHITQGKVFKIAIAQKIDQWFHNVEPTVSTDSSPYVEVKCLINPQSSALIFKSCVDV